MKKAFLFLTITLLSFNLITAQQKITETEKIASLGKIYGFLKYYHSEVGKGKYDWDKELIKYLPRIIKATDKEAISDIYCNWIDSLGVIDKCKKCKTDEHFFDKNFDLKWTQDLTFFNKELTDKLKYIEENRFQGKNFYVTNGPTGKIKVTNEPIYKNFEFPNEEYRLLGLFKYWNIIEYFYPYKHLTDQNWDLVLLEMIPKLRDVSKKEEYQYALKELIAKLDDEHAWIKFNNERPKYLPVKFSNIDNKAVVTGFYNDSIAKLNNLELGDIILKIDNVDTRKLVEDNLKYVSASNTNNKRTNTYYTILNGTDSIVSLTIERNKLIHRLQVNRYNFSEFKYSNKPIAIKSISPKIGYLNMVSVEARDVSPIFKSFKNKKSIIIDLRNYPNFIYRLISKQINSEKKDFVKYYSPNVDYPGRFSYQKNLQTGANNRKAFNGKIIILVNEKSMSRSEFTAMAFQTSDNVITVGSQTAGADGDVVVFEYMGGFRTTISGNGVLYPDGTETQRKGIKIDVEIKPTIEGIKQGRDEILEKAIELASE